MTLGHKVWEYMVKEPPILAPSDPVAKALKLIKEMGDKSPGALSLAVVDPETGKLQGVVTLGRIMKGLEKAVGEIPGKNDLSYWERPELATKLRQEIELVKVKDVMAKNIYQVKPYDSLGAAMEMMLEKKVRFVPVVEAKRLVGVIRMAAIYEGIIDEILGQ